jgi:putative peptidoglycan lipid II flippase
MTTNWKIFRAVMIIGVCSIVVKLVSTAKEVSLASWFGRGDALDAFLVAMILPASVASLVAGAVSVSVIPVFIRSRENQGDESSQQLFSSVQVASLLVFLVVSVLMAIGAPYYLPILGAGFTPAKLLLTRRLLYLLLPFPVLNGTITIWSSILNSGEKFALPAITPIMTPLVIVGALLLFGHSKGIFALAFATVIGSVCEAVLLGLSLRAHGFQLRLRWYGLSPEFRRVFWQSFPILAGSIVMGTSPIIDQSMAAMLSPGSVAALSYGYKVIGVIVAVTAAGLGNAVLAYLSKMAANSDWWGCRRTLKVYSLLILAVTVPITLSLIAGTRPLVRLLYQRGAFTPTDTAVVSSVQLFYAFLIPLSTLSMLYVRFLSAMHRNDLLAYSAVMNVCLDVFFNILLMRKMGVAGIALSTSLVNVVACAFVGFCAYKLLRKQEIAQDLRADFDPDRLGKPHGV